MMLSLKAPIVMAEPSENLVTNPGFEEGTDGWKAQGTLTFNDSGDAHTGSAACNAFDRTAAFASPYQDMAPAVKEWGPGDYLISAYVKIDGDPATDKMSLVLNVAFDGNAATWKTVAGDINNKSYTKIEGTVTLAYTVEVGKALLYLQSSGTVLYNFMCDDFSMQKVNGIQEPVAGPQPMPLDPIVNRPDKPLVTAIRWDAWLNPSLPTFTAPGTKVTDYIGAQMVRSLSPTQYHFRLPYFGIVENKDTVNFPDYTQEIFDQELLYAKEAGIDYFTYCWYADKSGMDMARQFHTTSKYRDDVKMAAIWDITGTVIKDSATYINVLKQSYYQKIADDRPIIYVNSATTQNILQLNKFRQACIAAGLKNPYLVGMGTFGYTPDLVKEQGLDALSDYAISGGGAKPYATLMQTAQSQWTKDTSSGVQYIPCVPTGWDRRPRIDHPVSWEPVTGAVDKTAYIQTASAPEIATLLQDAINFNKANVDKTNTNNIIIYAWNEHDEGGWLCPTIIDDDGDGMPQLRADGTNARDTRRLQAIQQVLKPGSTWTLDKDIDLSVVYPSPVPKLTPGATMVRTTDVPSATVAPQGTSGKLLLYGGIGTGVIVIAAAVVTAFVLKGKGKKAGPTDGAGPSE